MIVLTGAGGFLGWHVRVLAHAMGLPDPVLVSRADLDGPEQLARLLDGADRVLHLAGVNRGTDEDVSAGNIRLASNLADALRRCDTPPKTVVFANSIQAGNATPYGDAKAAAARMLAEATAWSGSQWVDLKLPNLFGEHGKPFSNSVVATFCHLLALGQEVQIKVDRELELLHATQAACLLLGAGDDFEPTRRTVTQLARQLGRFAAGYRTGEIPDLADDFDVRLFNTYRSHCFPAHYPLRLACHADARGELAEAVKVRGGGGQVFFSSTLPGVTRGEHYHLSKVERFVVVRGDAELRMRRLWRDDVLRLRVSGSEPVAVDIPAMWAHDITNVGTGELLTLFWTNEIYDPGRPDTYPERVVP